MPKLTRHWTERSIEDFLHKIAADFVQQIENYLSASGENRAEFAKKLRITPGRVSQVLNAPGNPTLKKLIEYARAANKKLAIIAYDDDDPNNERGPINSQVFEQCWIRQGRPSDFFALEDANQSSYAPLMPQTHRLPMPPGGITAVRGNNDTRSFNPTETAATRAETVLRASHYAGATTRSGD